MNKKFLSAILFGALAVASTGSFVSCKDYDDDIESLQSQITNLSSVKGDISSVQSALQGEISSAKAAAEAAQKAADAAKAAADAAGSLDAAKAYADAAVAAAKAEMLEQAQKTLDEVVAGAISEDQVKAAIAEALATIETVSPDEVDATVAEAVKAIKNEMNIDGKLEAMSNEIAALKNQDEVLKAYAKSADVTAEIAAEIKKVEDKIATAINAETIGDAVKSEIAKEVAKINADLSVISTRLTNLVFAPKDYINGIEAIKFATLQYADWGANLFKNYATWEWDSQAQKYKNVYTLKDSETIAEYYVSPSYGVTMESIKDGVKGLSFLAQTAENTRAAVESPIEVTKATIDPKTPGKLTLNLSKTVTENLGSAVLGTPWHNHDVQEVVLYTQWNPNTQQYEDVKGLQTVSMNGNYAQTEKFTIVALKATLADKVLTKEEAGKEVNVFSDWARLYETSIIPYIHNTLSKDNDGKLVEWQYATYFPESKKQSHFWRFTEVYGGYDNEGKNPKDIVLPYNYYNNRNIARDVYYKDAIDLDTVVTVCDQMFNEIDLASYNLKFYFNLVDYRLQNNNLTSDDTNQKYFAVIDPETNIMKSTARQVAGSAPAYENRDAIGRQPMVQAVLKDETNGKVVDVVYFKILWTDETVKEFYGPVALDKASYDYVCDGNVQGYILEEEMNKIYTKYDKTKSEFFATYGNMDDYSSFVDKNGDTQYANYLYLYPTKEAAESGDTNEPKLGKLFYLYDAWNNGQTQNMMWELNTTNHKITYAEYKAGKKTVKAYAAFHNEYSRIVIELTMNMAIKAMDKIGYDNAMWTTVGETRVINPMLYTDPNYGNADYNTVNPFETSQIRANIFKGYNYVANGISKTPTSTAEIVKNGDKGTFKFNKEKLADLATATKTAAADWTLDATGTILKYKTETAATIDNTTGNIQLWESNPGMADSKPSVGAKLLIGQNVPVMLVGSTCTVEDVLDTYNFYVMTPLEFVGTVAEVELWDIHTEGDKAATIAGKFQIKEVFTSDAKDGIVWDNLTPTKANPALTAWYDVKNFAISTTHKTNRQLDGTIGTECNVDVTKIIGIDGVNPKYDVAVAADGTVTWINNSGDALGQEIKITVPATIESKWQSLETSIVVTIHVGKRVNK